MSQSSVSIMVPVFRAAAYIREALESVFRQVTDDMEVLIFDDASDDSTLEEINRTVLRHGRGRILVVRHAVQEGSSNFIRMIEAASGEILIWCHGDDICLPHRFERVIGCFHDPRTMVVTSAAYVIDAGGRTVGLYAAGEPDQEISDPAAYQDILYRDTMLGATLAWRRQLHTSFPTDPRLMIYGEDMILPYRATLVGKHRFLSEPLVGWRLHGANNHVLQGVGTKDEGLRESYLALLQTVLMIRRGDIQRAIELDGKTPQLCEALHRVDELQLEYLGHWLRLRGQLLQSGKRAAWEPTTSSQATAVRYWQIPLGRPVETGTGSAGAPVLSQDSGWYEPESHGIWSKGTALMVFRVPAPAHDGVWLSLTVGHPAWAPPQRMTIESRGEILWSEAIDQKRPVNVLVPGRLMPDGELAVLLRIEPPMRPADFEDSGSSDTRLLGLLLYRFELQTLDALIPLPEPTGEDAGTGLAKACVATFQPRSAIVEGADEGNDGLARAVNMLPAPTAPDLAGLLLVRASQPAEDTLRRAMPLLQTGAVVLIECDPGTTAPQIPGLREAGRAGRCWAGILHDTTALGPAT